MSLNNKFTSTVQIATLSATCSFASNDVIGWLFAAFVIVVTAIAVMAMYNANDMMVTNTAVAHMAPPS